MRTQRQFQRRVKVGPPPYRLNLGCKDLPKHGYIGMDLKDFGQEIIWDVTEGIPLPDDSVTDLFMGDFLEHISEDDQPFLWHEIRRVCRHGSEISARTPHTDCTEGWDLMHVSRWCVNRIEGLAGAFNGGLEILRNDAGPTHLISKLRVVKGGKTKDYDIR